MTAKIILSASGIYAIRNTINSKVYVGQASNIDTRKRGHFGLLKRGIHHCRHLQRAYNRDGLQAFDHEVLELCDVEILTEREQFWMDNYRPTGLYNIAPAAGSNRGIKISEQGRENMSKGAMGKKLSDGHRQKLNLVLSKHRSNTLGSKLSEEHKAKISAANRAREYGASPLRGVKQKPETIAKRSASLTGKTATDETKRKLSMAQLSRDKSLNEAISVCMREKWKNPEYRERMLQIRKAARDAKYF